MHFTDRSHAGKKLAMALKQYRDSDVVVYALPRGGIIVASEVAEALGAPLDLLITRKIGHPYNPEYAVCAISEDGDLLCDDAVNVLDPHWLESAADHERQEAVRRRQVYLGDRPHIPVQGKIAIVVDDGIATGLTIRSAIRSLLKKKPREIIIAIPVAPHDVVRILREEVDACIVLEDSKQFLGSVGAYYDSFPQVTDAEVISILGHFYH